VSGFSSWVNGNFNLIQTVGIVGGLLTSAAALFTNAAASKRDAISREIDNILTLSEHHSNLWGQVVQNPELQRILLSDVDVVKVPPTVAEEVFINKAFAQYLTSWRIVNAGGMIKRKELEADAKWFFSLPLPHAVWEKTKGSKNQEFVRFIDRTFS